MKLKRGKLIVFEGIDGSGKSTQLERTAQWLHGLGYRVVKRREPTEGHFGRILRASAVGGRLSPEDERDHFVQDRRWHVENHIRPAMDAGQVVLLDRYYFSSIAYQGARGLDLNDIRRRNEAIAPQPDIVLLLDLDPETALQRIQKQRAESPNLYEKLDYLRAVRDIFLSLSDPFIRRIDARPDEETVWLQIETALSPLFPKRNSSRDV